MRQDIYTLPEIVFVAGQSNTIHWRLFKAEKVPFNGEGCTGNFSVVDYSDQTGEPLITKPLKFIVGDNKNGMKNIAVVDLHPNDTLGLNGKYIYQIIIKDINGDVDIPNQGFLLITHNINESFLK